MKTTIQRWMWLVGLVAGGAVSADTIISTNWNADFANGGVIPDADVNGWQDSRTLSGFADPITGVQVKLHISGVLPEGGYNGDLYGYLAHSSGFAVLLNRVGITSGDAFGYADNGFTITLSGSGPDIHSYGGNSGNPVVGSFSADGRSLNPLSVPAAFDSASRDALLSSFNGLDVNGVWTLFFSDMSGGNSSRVDNWELDISIVPEPGSVALGVLGLALMVVQARRRKHQNR